MGWWLTFAVIIGGLFVGLLALGLIFALIVVVSIMINEARERRRKNSNGNLQINADKAHRYKN